MSVLAVVQARMGSSRMPNKVMRPLGGMPMIEFLLRRLSRARRVGRIVLATSRDQRNDPLDAHVRSIGFDVVRGSEADVLDRVHQAAARYRPDHVVRITGDCPLTDPELVDEVVAAYETAGADYATNTNPPTYPDGLDVEVFSFAALEAAAAQATRPFEREHVTPFIRESGRFTTWNVALAEDLSAERWTVDESDDFAVVEAVVDHFAPRVDFGWREVLALRRAQPDIFSRNSRISRNEGARLTEDEKRLKAAARTLMKGDQT